MVPARKVQPEALPGTASDPERLSPFNGDSWNDPDDQGHAEYHELEDD